MTLPWEELNGNYWVRDRFTKLCAGEVWDGRVDKNEFVSQEKHDKVHLAIRDFVLHHGACPADGDACNLASELLNFRRSKRAKPVSFCNTKRAKLGAHVPGR